jgi:hypothetical protein
VATTETKKSFQDLLKEHAQRVFLAGLGVLLLIRILFFVTESSPAGNVSAQPQVLSNLKTSIAKDSDTYKNVNRMIEPLQVIKDSHYAIVGSFNAFDPQVVLQAAALQQQADALVQQATQAFAGNNVEQAQQLVNQALAQMPSHKGAQDLRAAILKKTGDTSQEDLTSSGSLVLTDERPTTATASSTPAP